MSVQTINFVVISSKYIDVLVTGATSSPRLPLTTYEPDTFITNLPTNCNLYVWMFIFSRGRLVQTEEQQREDQQEVSGCGEDEGGYGDIDVELVDFGGEYRVDGGGAEG